MLKKALLSLGLSIISILGLSPHLNESPTLYQFIDDIKHYKMVDTKHPGDLLQHSVWVYFSAIELVESDSYYYKNLNLSEREKDIFYLAALLHDIGKAGRKELFDQTHQSLKYQINKNNQDNTFSIAFKEDKQEHCKVGFEYVAAPFLAKDDATYKAKEYFLADGETKLDIDLLFSEMGITDDERKEIAILIGMHYSFGHLVSNKITAESFLDKIEELAHACSYPTETTEKLLRLSILIQVADVKGVDQVSPQKSIFLKKEFSDAELAPIRPLFKPRAFIAFGYDGRYTPTTSTFKQEGYNGFYNKTPRKSAMDLMDDLVAYFKEHQERITQNASIFSPGA